MKEHLPQEMVDEIETVLKKHGVERLYYPHALGQAVDRLKDQCLENSVPWMLSGILASYAIRTDAVSIIKKLVELLNAKGDKPLNYNDLDCNLWGKYIKTPIECLECSSIVSKIGGRKIDPKNCPRCKGTKLDPEFFDHAWVLYYDTHGNSTVFVVQETAISIRLHIRKLPYNLKKGEMVSFFNKFVEAAVKDRYDCDFEYMRYHDGRDTGFVMYLDYDKKSKRFSDCEGTLWAPGCLTTITEHFICVVDEFDVLVGEDRINGV